MVGIYVGCENYSSVFGVTERSFQARKMKSKELMVVSSNSRQTFCVQEDLKVEFNHLCRERKVKAALEIMDKMEKKGILLDSHGIVELLEVCMDLKLLEHGRRVHEYVMMSPSKPSSVVFNRLVEMYCKLGDAKTAKKVFDQMSSKNLDSWNLLLLGLADNGEGKEALQTFSQMKENAVRPNEYTFCWSYYCMWLLRCGGGRIKTF